MKHGIQNRAMALVYTLQPRVLKKTLFGLTAQSQVTQPSHVARIGQESNQRQGRGDIHLNGNAAHICPPLPSFCPPGEEIHIVSRCGFCSPPSLSLLSLPPSLWNHVAARLPPAFGAETVFGSLPFLHPPGRAFPGPRSDYRYVLRYSGSCCGGGGGGPTPSLAPPARHASPLVPPPAPSIPHKERVSAFLSIALQG